MSRESARRLRVFAAALVVAAIGFVPPLVRATERVGSTAPAPIRLNRGFDSPKAKCQIVPPATSALRSVEAPPRVRAGVSKPPVSIDFRREFPLDASPDALRGPPRLARS